MNKIDEINKFKDSVEKRLLEDGVEISFDVFLQKIKTISFQNKYAIWIIKKYLDNGIQRYEDMGRVENALSYFHKHKNRLEEKNRNIMNIKSLVDLENLIGNFIELDRQKELEKLQKEIIYSKTEYIYDGPEGKVLVPLSKEASIFWGKGTKWCTASVGSYNYFEHYNDKGSLYIIILPEKDSLGREVKYQFHFETNQFMDTQDKKISDKTFDVLVNEFDYFKNITSSNPDKNSKHIFIKNNPNKFETLAEIKTDQYVNKSCKILEWKNISLDDYIYYIENANFSENFFSFLGLLQNFEPKKIVEEKNDSKQSFFAKLSSIADKILLGKKEKIKKAILDKYSEQELIEKFAIKSEKNLRVAINNFDIDFTDNFKKQCLKNDLNSVFCFSQKHIDTLSEDLILEILDSYPSLHILNNHLNTKTIEKFLSAYKVKNTKEINNRFLNTKQKEHYDTKKIEHSILDNFGIFGLYNNPSEFIKNNTDFVHDYFKYFLHNSKFTVLVSEKYNNELLSHLSDMYNEYKSKDNYFDGVENSKNEIIKILLEHFRINDKENIYSNIFQIQKAVFMKLVLKEPKNAKNCYEEFKKILFGDNTSKRSDANQDGISEFDKNDIYESEFLIQSLKDDENFIDIVKIIKPNRDVLNIVKKSFGPKTMIYSEIKKIIDVQFYHQKEIERLKKEKENKKLVYDEFWR